MAPRPQAVLFACGMNAVRSPMAANYSPFIPAKAGTQCRLAPPVIVAMGSRFRGNERKMGRVID